MQLQFSEEKTSRHIVLKKHINQSESDATLVRSGGRSPCHHHHTPPSEEQGLLYITVGHLTCTHTHTHTYAHFLVKEDSPQDLAEEGPAKHQGSWGDTRRFMYNNINFINTEFLKSLDNLECECWYHCN